MNKINESIDYVLFVCIIALLVTVLTFDPTGYDIPVFAVAELKGECNE